MADGIAWDDEAAPTSSGIAWDDEPATGRKEAAPGFWRSLGLGLSQGGTFGFADELAGTLADVVGAGGEGVQPGRAASPELRAAVGATPSFGDGLKRAMRSEANAAADAHPGAYYGGEIVGAVAVPMPGGAVAQGASRGLQALKALGRGAATGGLYGAGKSEADLAAGEYGRFAGDVAIGSGAGAAAGAVGALVIAPAVQAAAQRLTRFASGLQSRAARGVQEAVDAEANVQRQLTEKGIRGAQGEYRSAVQSAARDLEVIEREAAALPSNHPVRKELEAFLASPEGMAVREQVATNKLVTAPERISEMSEKLSFFRTLAAGKEANIAAQTAEALSKPAQKHILPRALTLGHRFLPPAIASVGGIVGGPEGALVGGAVGTMMSLSQGLPGRIIKNLASKPAVRKAFWDKALAASGGWTKANEQVVRVLETAAKKSPREFEATAYMLSQNHPRVKDILRAIRDDELSAEE